ncbi:phosphatidylserine decarboxylase family protein [Thermodesulforhabdus norvegica]|uniref:Phosphatidylserine decarboxylase proenzyme n=1 Tax=Thermodesulforhabdus norvegica TaxID=39841 RepID=A0A1I4RK07_9BACT|nr:phosphatidylserine decarboxylase family protein [Thermodesulforhabdus norvegica]SFM52568.1 phosphatidylserine decarboxylase [Thermodesulforhabdus norvegica]
MDFRSARNRIPLAPEGIPFIGLAAFLTLILAILGWAVPALCGFLVTAFVTYFFRDPQRIVPQEPDCLVSPADGKIVSIDRDVLPPCFADTAMTRIGIFMSIFDVHVNRAPEEGHIRGVKYFRGSFKAAQLGRASEENEKNCILLETSKGRSIVLVQVAGLIARRIVFWPGVGDRVVRGEPIGMIRFGSRVDVYVPRDWEVVVSRGNRVRAGEDIICRTK